MKKICFVGVIVMIATILIQSCTKPGNEPAPPNPPDTIPKTPIDTTPFVKADFYVQAACNGSLFTDTLQKLFDPLLFVNTSDEGKNVKYHWSFGDGTESDSINPTHKYLVAGTYPVQLITYYDTIPKDTIARLLRIIIGLKTYDFDRYTYGVVGMDNADNDGTMVLLSSFNPGNVYRYTILRTDSILNQVYLKPLSATVTRLNSITKTKAGNYILSGNYNDGNTEQYALSLIDDKGNLTWQHYLNVQGKNYYTMETSDGGFITIGDEILNNNVFTTVVKCNSNGGEIWRQSFNTQQYNLNNAHKIIETSTGYVFAGLRKQNVLPLMPELIMTSLDFSGNITQQKTIPFQWSGGTGAPTEIAAAGDTYFAYTQTSDSVYVFDRNLNFLKSRQLSNLSINTIIGYNNNYYAGVGNDLGSVLSCDAEGKSNWFTNYLRPVTCSSPESFSVVQTTSIIKGKNDFIIAGYVNDISIIKSGTYLMRISTNGKVR